MKRAILAAWCLSLVFLSAARGEQVPFTLVALPDTQNYVNNASNAPLFTQQTEWIKSQIQDDGNPRNIQFVTHLGDVVSSGDSALQWDRADASMSLLDGVVPYGVLPGNHDYQDTGNKQTGLANYVSYFGPSRFAGEPWYGGADPSGANSYQVVSAGGREFLHLALEWRPTQNTPFRDPAPLDWAQGVLDANPTLPAIVSTHEYINDAGSGGRSGSGQAMWDQFVKANDQVFMVLGGHYHNASGQNDGEFFQVSQNLAGRDVIEVLQDYQDYPNGGDGWLRLINFDGPNNRIQFETYSPVLDQFQTETVAQVGGRASMFEVPVNFDDRLTPVAIHVPEPPKPSHVFQEGLNGYAGTQDKELRSSGDDSANGQFDEMSIDGDDGSPGQQPNHGLIRFDNILGDALGQLRATDVVTKAKLVLEVSNAGSGFQVHELLTNWDEQSTWSGLQSGIQPDGVEAVSSPIASLGANNSSSNIETGPLEIDVTASLQAYQQGLLPELGWALIPYSSGANGVDFYTSEAGVLQLRPRLEIFTTAVPEPASVALAALALFALSARRRS